MRILVANARKGESSFYTRAQAVRLVAAGKLEICGDQLRYVRVEERRYHRIPTPRATSTAGGLNSGPAWAHAPKGCWTLVPVHAGNRNG